MGLLRSKWLIGYGSCGKTDTIGLLFILLIIACRFGVRGQFFGLLPRRRRNPKIYASEESERGGQFERGQLRGTSPPGRGSPPCANNAQGWGSPPDLLSAFRGRGRPRHTGAAIKTLSTIREGLRTGWRKFMRANYVARLEALRAFEQSNSTVSPSFSER